MQNRRIPRFLYLWPLPAAFAGLMCCIGLVVFLRPTWPIGEVVLDSPNPIAAPFSGQPVCGYHVCVGHPGGSTCLGHREWAEPLEYTTPDGSKGTGSVRWLASEPNYEVSKGESRTALGELLIETDSERVVERCAEAACTWTEMLIPCGQSHRARWQYDDGVVNVQRAEDGLEGMAAAWIVAILSGVLVLLSGVLLIVFLLVRQASRNSTTEK